mgnify:FL=1
MEFNIIQSLILFYITNLLKSNIYLIFYKILHNRNQKSLTNISFLNKNSVMNHLKLTYNLKKKKKTNKAK